MKMSDLVGSEWKQIDTQACNVTNSSGYITSNSPVDSGDDEGSQGQASIDSVVNSSDSAPASNSPSYRPSPNSIAGPGSIYDANLHAYNYSQYRNNAYPYYGYSSMSQFNGDCNAISTVSNSGDQPESSVRGGSLSSNSSESNLASNGSVTPPTTASHPLPIMNNFHQASAIQGSHSSHYAQMAAAYYNNMNLASTGSNLNYQYYYNPYSHLNHYQMSQYGSQISEVSSPVVPAAPSYPGQKSFISSPEASLSHATVDSIKLEASPSNANLGFGSNGIPINLSKTSTPSIIKHEQIGMKQDVPAVPANIVIPVNNKPMGKSNIKVRLQDPHLWKMFSQYGTEMIITKSGRRMFPSLRVEVKGLQPNAKYFMFVEIVHVDDHRYKYQENKWVVSGKAELPLERRNYNHPDGPQTGSQWMKGAISFHKLKVTNNPYDRTHIVLHSMHKYMPRLFIFNADTDRVEHDHIFYEAEFIAVTAYQNENITKLKIENNPFAKGFRDGQTRRDYRAKRDEDNENYSDENMSRDSKRMSRETFGDSSASMANPFMPTMNKHGSIADQLPNFSHHAHDAMSSLGLAHQQPFQALTQNPLNYYNHGIYQQNIN